MTLAPSNIAKILALVSALLLGGCGGGGGSATPSVTEDTDLLVQNAALHSSKNIGVNMSGLVSMTSNSTVSSTLNKLAKSKKVKTSPNNRTASYDEQVHDYLLPTLEGGNTTRTRNGNTISIDPDENYVCQQWIADQQQTSNIDECAAILTDLSASITATSDDTGTISYLYAGENLLVIQYAPASGSYELILPTLKTLVQRAAVITDQQDPLPETIRGAIKLSADVENANDTEEAGSMSVSITQPIQIAGTAGNESLNFSLGRSTLFSTRSNAVTGNGNVSISINALDIAVQNLMGSDTTAVTTIEMPDFTLSADLERFGTEILLSNVGMGRGPFRIAIANNDVVTVALEKFSARYNDLTREADFLTAFDLDVAIEYSQAAFGWLGDDSSLRVAATLPAGTLLTEQLNGATKVERGGPFSYQSSFIDGSGDDENFAQNVSFSTGQCFDQSFNDERLELVSCD